MSAVTQATDAIRWCLL